MGKQVWGKVDDRVRFRELVLNSKLKNMLTKVIFRRYLWFIFNILLSLSKKHPKHNNTRTGVAPVIRITPKLIRAETISHRKLFSNYFDNLLVIHFSSKKAKHNVPTSQIWGYADFRCVVRLYIEYFFYFTGTVHIHTYFCKYARIRQKASFHLQSLARCYNRVKHLAAKLAFILSRVSESNVSPIFTL